MESQKEKKRADFYLFISFDLNPNQTEQDLKKKKKSCARILIISSLGIISVPAFHSAPPQIATPPAAARTPRHGHVSFIGFQQSDSPLLARPGEKKKPPGAST